MRCRKSVGVNGGRFRVRVYPEPEPLRMRILTNVRVFCTPYFNRTFRLACLCGVAGGAIRAAAQPQHQRRQRGAYAGYERH